MRETEAFYFIRILKTTKPNIWYSNKIGRTYEALQVKREGVLMFKVAALLYVYLDDAEIISIRREVKYSRY
jgi:hypothetical protein